MNKRRLLLCESKGFPLPYFFDATLEPDGTLPAPLVGSTFAISSSKVANTPGVGSNLLTEDPGLEGTYTGGTNDSLVKGGSPNVSQSADVHGGVKAQQFQATANNNNLWFAWPANYGIAGGWVRFSALVKRIAGTHSGVAFRLDLPSALPSASISYYTVNSSYEQHKASLISTATGGRIMPMGAIEQGLTPFDTVVFDDGIVEQLTYSTLFAMLSKPVSRLATVRIKPSATVDATLSTLVMWANAPTSPSTYLMAWWCTRNPFIALGLIKCVNGTYSNLITTQNVNEYNNMWIELKPVDNDTVALYYGYAQIGTNQDVSDVPGAYCGFGITGGNNVKKFWAGFGGILQPGIQTLPSKLTGKDDLIGVVLEMDDAFISAYTEVYPRMKAYGMRGSIFPSTHNIGASPGSYMSISQLQEMYADGWDIGSHGHIGSPLSGMSEADQETDLTTAKNELDIWGFTRSSRHVAYPGGGHNADTLTAMDATGMLTGRTVDTDYANSLFTLITPSPYDLPPALTLGNATSLAAAKQRIIDVLSTNVTCIVYGHKLAATAVDGNTWAIADFQALLD